MRLFFNLIMFEPFLQISLVLITVLGVSVLMRFLKQPLIIGYILSGILLGPTLFGVVYESVTLETFSKLGISFLLFMVGMHLSPKIIKDVGKISLITGLGQIIFTTLVGFLIGSFLGFDAMSAIYIAVALTFSSTIIIMKLLSDKEALDKLYGKVSMGFLLVQDFVAILILIILSSISTSSGSLAGIASTLAQGIGLIVLILPIGFYLLPKVMNFFAKSQEFLFIFAITYGLGLSVLFQELGFSIEVGALVAGISLSVSPFTLEISSKLKPLRDFFIISFFVILGSHMTFNDISNYIIPSTIFSLFILLGNPLIVMILMGHQGFSKKTSFMSGLTVAQISEFSLILIAMGVTAGSISSDILSFVTIIGLVTIAGSTYLITFSDQIYDKISHLLSIFEKKNLSENHTDEVPYDCLILGYDEMAEEIIKELKSIKTKYLIVEYDPDKVEKLQKKKEPIIFGDVTNTEFLRDIKFTKCKLLISTIPDQKINESIMDIINTSSTKPKTILSANSKSNKTKSKKLGCNEVVDCRESAGNEVRNIIRKPRFKKTFA